MDSSYVNRGQLICHDGMPYTAAEGFIKQMQPGSYVAAKVQPGKVITVYEIGAKTAKASRDSIKSKTREKFIGRVQDANAYVAGLMNKAPAKTVPQFIELAAKQTGAVDPSEGKCDYTRVVEGHGMDITTFAADAIVSPADPLVISTSRPGREIQGKGGEILNLGMRMGGAQFIALEKRAFRASDAMLVKAGEDTELATKNVIVVASPDGSKGGKMALEDNLAKLQQAYRNVFHLASEKQLFNINMPVIGEDKKLGFGSQRAGAMAVFECALAAGSDARFSIVLFPKKKATRDAIEACLTNGRDAMNADLDKVSE
jgi:O-acetyl-ADP-ribose deacetylase (regulator of RNase III)